MWPLSYSLSARAATFNKSHARPQAQANIQAAVLRKTLSFEWRSSGPQERNKSWVIFLLEEETHTHTHICLSVYLSINLPTYLSIPIICLSICLFIHPSIKLPIYHLFQFLCLSVSVSLSLSVCLSASLSPPHPRLKQGHPTCQADIPPLSDISSPPHHSQHSVWKEAFTLPESWTDSS